MYCMGQIFRLCAFHVILLPWYMLIVWPKLVPFQHTCSKGGYKKNRVETLFDVKGRFQELAAHKKFSWKQKFIKRENILRNFCQSLFIFSCSHKTIMDRKGHKIQKKANQRSLGIRVFFRFLCNSTFQSPTGQKKCIKCSQLGAVLEVLNAWSEISPIQNECRQIIGDLRILSSVSCTVFLPL